MVGLGFASCALCASQPSVEPDLLDPMRGVVFAGSSSRLLVDSSLTGEDLGATWDPSPVEIAQLEDALGKELTNRLSGSNASANDRPRARDYYRQYAGIHLKGHKLIFINGFHKSNVEGTVGWLAQPRSEAELEYFPVQARNKNFWRFVPVSVSDGGYHYFQAFYDPLRKRIAGFQFNGVA
jgi:hypothetical protein